MRSLELHSNRFARLALGACTASTLLLGALALGGCPDPEGAFDDFAARYDEINPGTTSSTSTGPVGCVLPEAGAADGQYLFALDPTPLSPGTPFVLLAELTTVANGDGLTAELVMQPLSKTDRKTPTGSPLPAFTNLAIAADGSFEWDLGTVTFPGEANPVSDSEVISTVQLQGSLCGGEEIAGQSHDGFICGTVTGIVDKPLTGFDLAGSNFAMQLVDGAVPDAVLNCDKDAALPLE